MRRLGVLCLILVAGCQRPATPVFVDLSTVSLPPISAPKGPEMGTSQLEPLPGASGKLNKMEGAQVNLSQTVNRIRIAKEVIAENKKDALKGLTNALFRSYSRKAEGDRNLHVQDLDKAAEAMWDQALEDISQNLKQHGRARLPLENRLALLIGFPTKNPTLQPRPENRVDAKRYDESVSAWRKLLAEDKDFAQLAQSILDKVQEDIDRRRVQIQIDFTKALNAASDRSQSEAESAVASRLPDFVGGLSQRPDVKLNPEPERTVQLPAVPSPSTAYREAQPPRSDLRRQFLEHDLQIWLAQNGYVLAEKSFGVPDRTKEFMAWVKKRRAGP